MYRSRENAAVDGTNVPNNNLMETLVPNAEP
jgi:hypothetical protein